MNDYNFCPRCGRPSLTLVEEERNNPYVLCSSCGFAKWNNPLPTTIGLIVDEGRVLLLRRAHPPRQGFWDTVGGFLAPHESAEENLMREAREELGVGVEVGRFIGSFPSAYGESGLRTVGLAFSCRIANGSLELSPENSEIGWFPLDSLPEMAFEDGAASLIKLTAPGGV